MAIDWGSLVPYAGAAGGFLIGGPAGAAVGYGLGSWAEEQFFDGDGDGAISEAERAKLQSFQKASDTYGAMRPAMWANRQQAMDNQLAAYKGAENALSTLYGGSGGAAPPGGPSWAPVSPGAAQGARSAQPPMGPSPMMTPGGAPAVSFAPRAPAAVAPGPYRGR